MRGYTTELSKFTTDAGTKPEDAKLQDIVQ